MEPPMPGTSKNSPPESLGIGIQSRTRINRARKRKRLSSDSSSDMEDVLPENSLEVEKNLHASAVKNNLDDVSVKKILKKVVTNDHVLALVKLREEEEKKAMKKESLQPKLTRAKVKELMKVSPKTAPWNLENMELTPIKHIPVKTRPEVKALITQELQDDEDDDEYQPTHDDMPSDDDHGLESCSDADSQPRTPATPRRLDSPRVLKDGPFKVPQDVSTPRRKLELDEDATIALRTRSKLSLSSIPIDHIENSFVPPDELPMPIVDDIWTEFLQECMNPDTSKHEDDEDDPEYNVAADQDAHDEDEEGLENIIKISKKELNDLVTELFNIMPETTAEDALGGKLAAATKNNTPSINIKSQSIPVVPMTHEPTNWEGKQEPLSDEETATVSDTRQKRMSIGKSEPLSETEEQDDTRGKDNVPHNAPPSQPTAPKPVRVSVVEGSVAAYPSPARIAPAPAPLQNLLVSQNRLVVHIEPGAKVLPEQILILQQQLRQHVQIATTSFLQLFVHPVHWALAPTYKEYLETLTRITSEKADSIANVCNLKPALALMKSWEESVSADTPENTKMVEFVQKEVERARRRAAQNSLYVGDFHETFINVVANSPVFLYPHLLPPLPFRSDVTKRFSYLRSEDELIALGIDEFWQYVEDNGEVFKVPVRSNAHRWGLVAAVQLLCKHLLPWLPPKAVLSHVQHVRKSKDTSNPIYKFFISREITPVQHVLLPFNPNLTLYEQPEHEMPRVWVRHLAKSSKRFRDYYYRRTSHTGKPPAGVVVDLGTAVQPPKKKPLPISFTKEIVSNRLNVLPPLAPKPVQDKFDIEITPASTETLAPALYSVVQTPSGAYLVPLSIVTDTVDSAAMPVCSTEVKETVASNLPEESNVPKSVPTPVPSEHCQCCVRLRKICKERQSLITDFFTPRVMSCPCKEKRRMKYPRITKKLRLLVNNYKSKLHCAWQGLQCRTQSLTRELKEGAKCNRSLSEAVEYGLEEIAAVTSFQLKLTIRMSVARNNFMKKKIHTLLSRFHPDSDEPYELFDQMDKAFEIECVDVYKEFMGFLTLEQADRIGRFTDYFKQESLTELIKRVEEQVSNKWHQLNILQKLRRVITHAKMSPCEMCTSLLEVLGKYPKLASHVFSLFPHRQERGEVNTQINVPPPSEQRDNATVAQADTSVESDKRLEEDETVNNESETVEKDAEEDEAPYEEPHEHVIDYEADNSASDDEESLDNLKIIEDPEEIDRTEGTTAIKNEVTQSENVIDTPQITITKTEVQDYSESEMSMVVMSEDEVVKSEPLEWKRDEDKLLLEVLQQSLTPEEKKDKTILEIIEEKNVLQVMAESLHKSLDDVRERIVYLLQMIVMNNNE